MRASPTTGIGAVHMAGKTRYKSTFGRYKAGATATCPCQSPAGKTGAHDLAERIFDREVDMANEFLTAVKDPKPRT